MPVDPALLERYRTRAPRYTSYPPAPHFHALDDADVHAALGRGRGALSVYLHVPFCQSLCWYCGCHTEILRRRTVATPYVHFLIRELALLRERLAPGRRAVQLALGGGTPTFMLPEDMRRLIEAVDAAFPPTGDADRAIEIDPRTVDDAYLDLLWELGFNRFSFGVQTFDPAVQDAIHRVQPVEMVQAATERLRSHGDPVVNYDLLYGLPLQSTETFARTLDHVERLAPSRVALFQYAHVPWMKPAQKLLDRHPRPDTAEKAAMFALAVERLGRAGYRRIGLDHFALPGDPLLVAYEAGEAGRNFQGYTTHADVDLVGLGVSAIGAFGGAYTQNLKDRRAWQDAIVAGRLPVERGYVLSDDDLLRRDLIMRLMATFEVRWDELGVPAAAFADELARLAPMERDGILTVRPDGVFLTEPGRELVRNVCSVFDRHLEADEGARRYSKTA